MLTSEALDIPFVYQGDDPFCVPACLKMVLEYLGKEKGIRLPNLTLNQIAKIVETDTEGTPLDNVTKINEHLRKVAQKVEFLPSEGNDFEDIRKELESGGPVIVWMKEFPDRGLKHSVVVKEIEEETLTIIFNDPIYGERREPATSFQSSWDRAANILIRVRVASKPPQTDMEEYV